MMQTITTEISKFKNYSANQFFDFIFLNVYSDLKENFKIIDKLITTNHFDNLDLLLGLVYSEFEILQNKERLMLLPFLLELEKTNSKSENCTTFKDVKKHFTSLISNLQLLKKLLISECQQSFVFNDLLQQVNAFESTLIEIQKTKDKYYFLKFKNCTGCK